jgi:protease IV
MNDSANDSGSGTPSTLATLKSFFAGIGKILSILGKIAKAFLVLLIVVGVIAWIGIISSWTQGENVDIPDSGALRVELNGYLVDELSYQDPYAALLSDDQPGEHLLRDLIDAIDAAAEDERINSIVLVMHDFAGGGSSKVLELGEAINRFKDSGKPVYAAADLYSQQSYLLASFADTIYINPFGGVELKGLGSYRSYYGDAFEKLKVNFHVFRTGEFKDAVEPFIAGEMSAASASQALLWLEDIWQVYRDTISENRGIALEALDRYSNQYDQLMLEFDGDSAEVALQSGLVDGYYHRDEILSNLMVNIGANEEEDFYLYTNYRPYLRQTAEEYDEDTAKVALVLAVGTIRDGQQPAGSIGGDSLSAQLKRVRETENLSALLLRVDSPGGSAFASDLIRRELALYDEEGIPVVISMGSLAASGGYWISMPADEIWATQTTLTGSIGVFGIVPTVEETLETVGIRRDGVGTGPLANAFILDLPMTDQVAQIIQSGVDHIYDDFLALVSDSRGISIDDLDNIAQGRVWTGNQAIELGLVDHIGGLKDAADAAADLAGVADNYQLIEITPPLSWSEQLTRIILDSVSSWVPAQTLSRFESDLSHKLISYWSEFQSSASELSILLNDPGHQYLYCGTCQSSGFAPQP